MKITELLARKAFELCDFTHLQHREPVGISSEGLTPNKADCFSPQITGLHREREIYMKRENRSRLLGVGERREGMEQASYFSPFFQKALPIFSLCHLAPVINLPVCNCKLQRISEGLEISLSRFLCSHYHFNR